MLVLVLQYVPSRVAVSPALHSFSLILTYPPPSRPSPPHHLLTNPPPAQAGLNLNVFGALSGAFSSKSKKQTHQNPDGSSHSVEDREELGRANGVAQGQGQAFVKGESEQGARKMRGVEGERAQGKIVEGKRVDHLGIEG